MIERMAAAIVIANSAIVCPVNSSGRTRYILRTVMLRGLLGLLRFTVVNRAMRRT